MSIYQLTQVVLQKAGVASDHFSLQPRSGGSINACFAVATRDGKRYFLKYQASAPNGFFAAEAAGLRALASSGVFRVPGIIAQQDFPSGESILLLEYIDLFPLSQHQAFGEALARLHLDIAPYFGWTRDNFIGTTPQSNSPAGAWGDFYLDARLLPQLRMAIQHGLDRAVIARVEQVSDMLEEILPVGSCQPALLHGDLWSANLAQDSEGRAVIFDPACYWGDADVDLAMLALFSARI